MHWEEEGQKKDWWARGAHTSRACMISSMAGEGLCNCSPGSTCRGLAVPDPNKSVGSVCRLAASGDGEDWTVDVLGSGKAFEGRLSPCCIHDTALIMGTCAAYAAGGQGLDGWS